MDGGFARVNVGAADMEEGGVIPGGHLFGLPVVHDVVRQGGNLRGQCARGAQGRKRMERGHESMGKGEGPGMTEPVMERLFVENRQWLS